MTPNVRNLFDLHWPDAVFEASFACAEIGGHIALFEWIDHGTVIPKSRYRAFIDFTAIHGNIAFVVYAEGTLIRAFAYFWKGEFKPANPAELEMADIARHVNNWAEWARNHQEESEVDVGREYGYTR